MSLIKRESPYPGYYFTETITDGENGTPIECPPLGKEARITCTMIAGANTGKFQYSTTHTAVETPATATWIDWPNGDTTGTYSDSIIAPVIAVRGVSVSGGIKIEIVV